MSIPQLGKLVEIDLREAWPHEARTLTPWLAENLGHLAEVIGIPLELQGTEVAVEQYSADLLARNPHDNSLVLIENQLECSDTPHLGQIMTYLAGLDAQTVIWIAKEFRAPHLSAIRWLNENTGESFSFFAIRLRAVRIGDSLPAPQFEVCCRPNEWERQLHTVAQVAKSDYGQLCSQFWKRLIERHPSEEAFGPAKGGSARWRTLKELGLVVGMYLGWEDCGVFVRGPFGADPGEILQQLEPQCAALEAATGIPLEPHPEGRFLIKRRSANHREQGTWDAACDWLHATADEYESMLRQAFAPAA